MNAMIGWFLKRWAERSSKVGLGLIVTASWQAYQLWATNHFTGQQIVDAIVGALSGSPVLGPSSAFVAALTGVIGGVVAFVTHDGSKLANVPEQAPSPPPASPNH